MRKREWRFLIPLGFDLDGVLGLRNYVCNDKKIMQEY